MVGWNNFWATVRHLDGVRLIESHLPCSRVFPRWHPIPERPPCVTIFALPHFARGTRAIPKVACSRKPPIPVSKTKPGFWKKLERSIRKRRNQFLAFVLPKWFKKTGGNVTPESVHRSALLGKTPDRSVQAKNLGLDFAPPRVQKVVIGIVTFNQTDLEIRQLASTASQALRSPFCEQHSEILFLDNGQATTHVTSGAGNVSYLPSRGNIGFGAAQNILMTEAFKRQADLYIAANPDGRFHPDAVEELIRMLSAHGNRALIEATQFPDEHPKEFDPETFDTTWVSGACLAIPKVVYESIGGFDEAFFMYCEDVDYSWRARAAGFAAKVCPRSLFYHAVTNRPYDHGRHQRFLSSGLLLAKKWRSDAFEKVIRRELTAGGFETVEGSIAPVPETWTHVCDFGHRFSFAATRW